MDKKKLKEALIASETQLIADLRAEIDSLHDGVDLDEGDTLDPEDYSHQSEAGDIERGQEQRLIQAQALLEGFHKLPTEPLTEAGPGALVETKEHLFYIVGAARQFEFEGREITPISIHAPLFEQLSAAKSGDQVVLGDHKELILHIS